MNFCSKCGAILKKSQYLCPNCGENINNDIPTELSYEYSNCNNTLGVPKYKTQKDRIIIALCYIGFLIIVPILVCKYTPYVKFHINQGLSLIISEIIYCIIYYIVYAIVMTISQWLYPVVAVLGIAGILFIIFSLFGIAGVIKDEKRELPLVGGFRILK